MNAVERLETAIAKLEEMKTRSTSGVWSREGDGVGFRHEIRGYFSVGYVALDADMRDIDAELIVTLHRTIDAQLAILRREHKECSISFGGMYSPPDPEVVDLADAILGGES